MEYLDGTRGLLPAILCWLLVLYPVLTLPVFLRLFVILSADEVARGGPEEPRAPRTSPGAQGAPPPPWDEAVEPAPAPPRSTPPTPTSCPASHPPARRPAPPAPLAPPAAPVRPRLRALPGALDPDPGEARRLRSAARRVARNPELDRWIRAAAREYLERTGS